MLAADNLTKRYGTLVAVDGVSFEVAPGRVLAILGPNGSGKSTIVKMLAGLIAPNRGRVRYRDRDVKEWPVAYKALVGYVPEEAQLYTYLTAPEYLALVGGLRGLSPRSIEARTERFLTLFGVWHDRYLTLAEWSKGMRQKALISAALLHDPEILILDEPNSGLDVSSTLVLREMVHALAAEGKIVIYSSHLLDVVEKVASDVCILHHGRVVARDTVMGLRTLSRQPSLEAVFAELVIEEDVEQTARALLDAMRA